MKSNKLKKLFSPKWKRHKKKSETSIPSEKKVPKKRFRKWVTKIKEFLTKNYPEQIKAVKKFILIVLGYGLVINTMFYSYIHFHIVNILALGIAYYFITDEFVQWFRRLIAKR